MARWSIGSICLIASSSFPCVTYSGTGPHILFFSVMSATTSPTAGSQHSNENENCLGLTNLRPSVPKIMQQIHNFCLLVSDHRQSFTLNFSFLTKPKFRSSLDHVYTVSWKCICCSLIADGMRQARSGNSYCSQQSKSRKFIEKSRN